MSAIYDEELVTKNLKLVPYLFHRLKRTALTERYSEDIIAEGYIGLIKAAQTYDPMKSKFSTYASRCIVNAMRMFIRRTNKSFYAEISLETPIGKQILGYSQSYVSRCLTKLKQAYYFGRE